MTHAYDRLLYRRQWLAGPESVHRQGWQPWRLGSLHGIAHPDIAVTAFASGGTEICLLGDVFDPDRPQADNRALVATLAVSGNDFQALENSLEYLGGRWVLFAAIAGEVRVYPDATASRPVFYGTGAAAGWCGASPNLLAEHLDLAPAEELRQALDPRTPAPALTRSHHWPGTRAPFHDLRRALPNHYVNPAAAAAVRFWPREPIGSLTLAEGASQGFGLLRGTIDAVLERGQPVYLALTAGYDSRSLLACSYHRHESIRYFALDQPTRDPIDRARARELAQRYRLRFNEVPVPASPPGLVETFDRSTGGMVVGACRNIACGYLELPDEAVFLEGTASETARAYYYQRASHPRSLTADYLCAASGFDGNPAARREFGEWLDDVPTDVGIRPLDLYYWEMRLGGWSAMDYTGQDLVRRVLSPYNNRGLLRTLLAAPEASRRPPFKLHRAVCEIGLPGSSRVCFNNGWRDRVRDHAVSAAYTFLPGAVTSALRARRRRHGPSVG